MGACCALLFLISPDTSRRSISLTFKNFTTDRAGHRQAVFELHNSAGDCVLVSHVLRAVNEEYWVGSATARTNRGFLTQFIEDGKTISYVASSFAETDTKVACNLGGTVKLGETATLTFDAPPDVSWRLLIDCERASGSSRGTLREKLTSWNDSANRKWGLPLLFHPDWSMLQVTSPAIPARAVQNGQIPLHLGSKFEFEAPR